MPPLPPTKHGRIWMGEQIFLGKCMDGYFTWGPMIGEGGGELMFKRFQRSRQVSFPLIDPDLDYWYIIWKFNTTNKELNLKITVCRLCLWGWKYHVKPLFFLKKMFSGNPFCDVLIRFTHLYARLREKWVKALHLESEGSSPKPRFPVTLRWNKYQTEWLTSG